VCLQDGREPCRLRPHGRVLGLERGDHRAQLGRIVRRKGGASDMRDLTIPCGP
jgi:hypothetical protein